MRHLRQPIFILQWILIIFSIIAFVLAAIDGFKMTFDFSSNGFQLYLKLFEPYSILFAATFVAITAHLAIERLGLMSQANTNSFMASNRTQWIQVVKDFYSGINNEDPFLCKELSRQLLPIHDYLFDKEYKILTKKDTEEFFNKFFAPRIQFFEEMNTKYLNIACYHDDKQSFSWGSFRYVIFAMLNIDNCYKDFLKDLETLYQEKVLEFSRQYINLDMYKIAIESYYKNKRQGTELK